MGTRELDTGGDLAMDYFHSEGSRNTPESFDSPEQGGSTTKRRENVTVTLPQPVPHTCPPKQEI